MRLRAEYDYSSNYKEGVGYRVEVTHKGNLVGFGICSTEEGIPFTAAEAINSHMEKVTRMLETPVEPSEEADELAQRGDRLQQEEADRL